jgi:hypothetical protein
MDEGVPRRSGGVAGTKQIMEPENGAKSGHSWTTQGIAVLGKGKPTCGVPFLAVRDWSEGGGRKVEGLNTK